MDRLPGFRDFYPEPLPNPNVWSADARNYIFDTWRGQARRYGFREYDGPALEPLELYTLKSGQEIVGQLYNFIDKGERAVSLRPEMTPTLARLVAAHERSYKKPIKWFAIPQLFRYERQQKGRLREHFQFNADIVGESDPAADAELIALLIDSLRALGLTAQDFVVRLSSRNAWQQFFAARNPDPEKAYEFYQAIDKLEREDPGQSEAKLLSLGSSTAEVNAFIARGEPTVELGFILTICRRAVLGILSKWTTASFAASLTIPASFSKRSIGKASSAPLLAGEALRQPHRAYLWRQSKAARPWLRHGGCRPARASPRAQVAARLE